MAKVTPDTIIACPPLITEKVRQFEEHLETYTSGEYNEAQLRVDFLNPMLEALGWDVNNDKGYAEAYRDVVYEDAIKVGGTTKAPDYGFYIGGRAAGGGRKFFLEAKKPSVAIRVDPKSAFQLRRYAYSAQLPLSILTNFKEFIAYDTRYKPSAKDGATVAAVLRIQYTEYAERWHEIASVFSRDAILRGAFDKFAVGKRKKGMEPLGESFLKDIEGWRDLLAKNIATSNPDISVDDLNFAVQRTIDRILFLRICEDRGIEQPGNLMQLLNGDRVYDRLGEIFRGADDRYNSGIFHFPPPMGKKPDPDRAEPPDDLTLDLTIDDKPLKQIIRGLYDTGQLFTTYAFAVIPPEILGHVYEQFLGKVIRLTPGRRIKIEEKPEVRKAGGVYYTPVYIVDYIVKNTVGKLLEGKTPKDAAKLRILDPASGSGSFLIGAYQFLLDWHLRWYLDNDPAKHCRGKNPALMRIHSPSLDEERDAPRSKSNGKYDYRITTAKRKAILLNSIYGVDIDPQAVEVTKLSLLLKVLEGESQESIAAQMKFLHQRALPDLGRNIKCGNSLIGDDFDDTDLSDDERKKINKFNWEREFPKIFKAGGFDAVIGNPPWGGDIDTAIEYFHARYPRSTQDHTDSFKLFIDRATTLVAIKGFASFIVPNAVLRQRRLKDVRQLLLDTRLLSIVDLGEDIFAGVVAPSCVFVLQRGAVSAQHELYVQNLSLLEESDRISSLADPRKSSRLVKQSVMRSNPEYELGPGMKRHPDNVSPLGQVKEVKLKDAGINYQRVKVGMQAKGKSNLSDRLLYEGRMEKPAHQMYWKGSDIDRYFIADSTNRFCRPNYKEFVRKNEVVRLNISVYDFTPKLLIRQTADRPIVTIDNRGVWFGRSIIGLLPTNDSPYDMRYFLGLLNCKYLHLAYQELVQEAGRVFAQVKLSKLKQLPFRTIDFSNKSDKAAHHRMVKLVDRMLGLHKKLAGAKSPLEKERIPRDIAATDRQIDKLVYDLYQLTDEEIAMVEAE